MPDRPRNGGPEDGPDYQWLYGQGGAAGGPASHPAGPAPAAPQPRRDPGDEGPTASHRTSSGRPPGPRRRRWHRRSSHQRRGAARGGRFRFRFRYVFLILLLGWPTWSIVPVVAWNKVDKVEWEPDGDRPSDQPGTTYLLVGSDSRAGPLKEQRKELSTGDASGGRTDTIMLLHTGSGPNLLLSIPRDSLVDIPGHGSDARSTRPTPTAGPSSSCRRSSRTPASGSTTTSRSGWAAWRASSTRSAASRCARSRT